MPQLSPDSVNAVFSLPHPDGRFEGRALEHLRAEGKKRPAILLAFPPKAAGTYLRTAILYAADGQLVRAGHAQGGRDAVPYLPTFIAYYAGGVTPYNLVAHAHMQALPANRAFLEAFGIRPVAMMRPIPDMLASYWDMLENDPEARKDGLNCLIPDNFPEFTREAKADFLVDIIAPWYASYYASWIGYDAERPGAVCMLQYDDFRADPAGELARALAHAGVPRARPICESALAKAWSVRDECRYNKAEAGRGARYFSPAHVARLRRMLGTYRVLGPHIDALLHGRAVGESLRAIGPDRIAI
jgi:hypothetical protein